MMLNSCHVILFHRWFIDDTRMFLVTEYCEVFYVYRLIAFFFLANSNINQQGDLSELIKKKKETNIQFEMHETFAYFYDIVNAVYYLHKNGIIHRDISNLLLKNNRIKLCDFGVSRMRSIESTIELSTRVGTLCYMSPELRNNEAYGENTDIW